MNKEIVGIFVCTLLILISVFSVFGSVNITKNNIRNQTYIGNDYPQIQWWYNLNAPSLGSAAVGDIDNDGNLEIVFGTYFNDENIYALNAENGTLLWKYNTSGCNDASPAIADVDLDGKQEVIIPASSPSTLYCFDGKTGNVKWSRFTGTANCIDSPPAIADVDNDGKPEIVFGTFNGYVFCLNGEDGSICWQINLGINSYIQSCPNIIDIGNNQKEVVVAQWKGDHRIYALNGENGSIKWYSNLPTDSMYHGGSFADINEDGKTEIAIGCYDKYVYVLNSTDGSLVWKYLAPYYVGAPTSIADLNNDGHLEIVFVSYNKIGVLSHTGSLLWSYTVGGDIFRGAAIADINGDGILDVVFGADDGKLRVLSGDTGQEIWTYDLQAHYGKTFNIDNAPVVADFNNNGKLDIFVVGGYASSSPPTNNHGRAYVLSAGDGTGPGWPMFRHDLRHSGCFNTNQPPEPPIIKGPSIGTINVYYTFSIGPITNPDGDSIYCKWDWSDGNITDWLGPFDSGQIINASYMWTLSGVYEIRVKIKDTVGAESSWSEPHKITIIENGLPTPPIINGPTNGKVGINYEYTFNSTDLYIDKLIYLVNWGDGTQSEITGLSGNETITNHTWSDKGIYLIKAKAKNVWGAESGEGKLKVIMPRTEGTIVNLLFRFYERLPFFQKLLNSLR